MPLIVNTKTGKEVSPLWLIPTVPVFLVGLFFWAVCALTCWAVVVACIAASPTLSAGPVSTDVDWLFVIEVLRLDHWLVGLVGLSDPWLATIPGLVSGAVWECATRGR